VHDFPFFESEFRKKIEHVLYFEIEFRNKNVQYETGVKPVSIPVCTFIPSGKKRVRQFQLRKSWVCVGVSPVLH